MKFITNDSVPSETNVVGGVVVPPFLYEISVILYNFSSDDDIL